VYISLHKARCTIINRFFFSYLRRREIPSARFRALPRAYFALSLKYLSVSPSLLSLSLSLSLSPSLFLLPDYFSTLLRPPFSLSVLSRRFPTHGFPALSSRTLLPHCSPIATAGALANSFLSPGFPNLSLFSARFTLFSPCHPAALLRHCRFVFRPRFSAELEPRERSAISFATRFILLAAFL